MDESDTSADRNTSEAMVVMHVWQVRLHGDARVMCQGVDGETLRATEEWQTAKVSDDSSLQLAMLTGGNGQVAQVASNWSVAVVLVASI